MVFSSISFITLFLPLFLGAYYLTPNRLKSLTILLGSYVFYAWWRVDFLALFAGVTFFNYVISLQVAKPAKMPRKKAEKSALVRRQKIFLWLGVAGNLLTLGFFKYFNFGVNALSDALGLMGGTPFSALHVILPIGISFYIFQSISYLVDIKRGDAKPAESFIDFAAFIALFPQLIAGPVIRYKDVAKQFKRRTHTMAHFNEGAIRFMLGFCKKVFIADSVAPVADQMFAIPDPTFLQAWLGIIAYTIQLYFDFSGYSDMAIGLGLMMGFRFIENFNQPYMSHSITEFWRRWHISLSTWLRDYLYIPLGGNRKGKARTYINLMLTMVLGGFWHGANWTFIAWGFWHGLILCWERAIIGTSKRKTPYPKLLAWPITLGLVMIGWVFFRSPDVGHAFTMLHAMSGLNGFGRIGADQGWKISELSLWMIYIGWLILLIVPFMHHGKAYYGYIGKSWAAELTTVRQLLVASLFLLALAKLVAQSHSPFLYFQF